MVENLYFFGITNKRDHPEIDFSKPPNSEIDWAGFDELREIEGMASACSSPRFNFSVSLGKKKIDILRLNADFIVSEKTKKLVENLGCAKCEWLPVMVNSEVYYLWILRTVLDCLDKKHSKIIFFPGKQDRIMAVKKYVFDKNSIPEIAVFKIPQKKNTIFFSPKAKEYIESAGVNGFRFFDIENPPDGELVG